MTQQTGHAEPELDFDDRQRQVYPASSQADPGNDIHTGSPGLLKAPTRGPASLAQLLTARGVERPSPDTHERRDGIAS